MHRDLKPANVKVTGDGAVKLLDFGLATALEPEAALADIANSPTLTYMATQTGIILGTAAYMSPEQAKGKTVDRRSDIWSFGCLFYEMLTGEKAFGGETVTDILASVIKSEPEIRNGALVECRRKRRIQRQVRAGSLSEWSNHPGPCGPSRPRSGYGFAGYLR